MGARTSFLICIDNSGAEDLQVLKIYQRLPDEPAEGREMVRVIDDSGEDYLYPRSLFLAVPSVLAKSLEAATGEPSSR